MLILFGGLMSATGVMMILGYLWEAIILKIGEADQSCIFWYLPILLLGVIFFRIGLNLFFTGSKYLGK